jgi:hypothetical protein
MNTLMTAGRAVVLLSALTLLAAPGQAAQRTQKHNDTSLEQTCRDLVGKEQYDGEGRGGAGRLQAQRFGECMIGLPH